MRKLDLYVLDDDVAYAERLAVFIRSTDFAEILQVKLFTQSDVLVHILEELHLTGILLLSDSFYPLFQHHPTPLVKICLSANIKNSNTSETMIPFVFRFQPLHQLLTRAQAIYTEAIQFDRRTSNANKTRVLSVYSSSGHCGKSVTAVHLAKQLAFRGERVMYVSLETVSVASQWLEGETCRLSQLIYYLKVSPGLFGPKLELLKSHDPKLRFDYLTPHEQMREMQEMSGEDVRQLVSSIRDLAVYDTLILDLEATVHPRIVKCLELSDAILWLVRDDWNDAFKTQFLYKQMNAYASIHFIMTCYRGSQSNKYEFIGKNMTYRLPYIPEWKGVSTPDQVWQSELFSEQVYAMFKAVRHENMNHANPVEGEVYLESKAV